MQMETSMAGSAAHNIVFSLGLRHTFLGWSRGLALVYFSYFRHHSLRLGRCRKNLPLCDSIELMNTKNEPTAKQGQYLAFIYYYTKLNGQPPAESDMQRYFGTTPPTVHNMVVMLCDRGFISREPGRGRTIQLLVDRDAFPDLE